MGPSRKAMNWRMAETSAADSSPRGSRQAETPPPRASSGKTSERLAAWVGSILFPLTLYIAGFLVFFRWQIFSDFDLVFGDAGDTRLAAFLHEHIFRWLYVRLRDFCRRPFFFNQAGTLGYSDAFLLDQILYAPLRLLGAEPLLAISLIAVILSGVGYLFFYLFLRRLDVSVPLASLAAFIFTFANNLYLKSGHFQHFTVYYIPIVAYCGLLAVSEVHQRPHSRLFARRLCRRSVRSFILEWLLYGLVFRAWAPDLHPDRRLYRLAACARVVEQTSNPRARARAGGEPQLCRDAFDIHSDLCAGAWPRALGAISVNTSTTPRRRSISSMSEAKTSSGAA